MKTLTTFLVPLSLWCMPRQWQYEETTKTDLFIVLYIFFINASENTDCTYVSSESVLPALVTTCAKIKRTNYTKASQTEYIKCWCVCFYRVVEFFSRLKRKGKRVKTLVSTAEDNTTCAHNPQIAKIIAHVVGQHAHWDARPGVSLWTPAVDASPVERGQYHPDQFGVLYCAVIFKISHVDDKCTFANAEFT